MRWKWQAKTSFAGIHPGTRMSQFSHRLVCWSDPNLFTVAIGVWDQFNLGAHTIWARFARITNPCPNFFSACAPKIYLIFQYRIYGYVRSHKYSRGEKNTDKQKKKKKSTRLNLPEFCWFVPEFCLIFCPNSYIDKILGAYSAPLPLTSYRWALKDAIDLVAYSEAPDLLQDIQY